ncbi:hypothetical protein SDRG_14816 [Saprolegnia diclina VS20]|uniref:Uncharacterized protein n=1 Tax=Saprolegnia diclina (strain VS20) TaxID=1156394 RepID=T0PPK1_SAPDV|nr:hypothetical protein SDRG_14816 [Saprolegnia diclina VS20]EQC27374.1 hypothetical protein SDRG_14816 [Saprolegnia diclina VS20]|eukprot:XP_008619193.1 hypothetical protein SDRG_14816 [Saprolegnia diclina VS20]
MIARKYDAIAPEIRQYLRATLTPLISIFAHAMHMRRLRAFLCWRMHTTKAAVCAAQTLVVDRLRLVARGLVRARQAEQITARLSRVLIRSRMKQLLHGFLHWKVVVTQYAQIASYAPEYMHWIAQHPTHLPLLQVRDALLQCKATLLLRAVARCRPCRHAWHIWKRVTWSWPVMAQCLQRLHLAFLLHRWRTYAQAKHTWQLVTSTTCARLRTHRVRVAVQRWRYETADRQHARTLRVVTRLAHKRVVMSQVFARWQATGGRWHHERARVRTLVSYLHRARQSKLEVAWTRWSTALWRRQRIEQRLQRILRRRAHRYLDRAVLALRLHSITQLHCIEARHSQQQWRSGTTAAMCLRLWRQRQRHRLIRGFITWQHHNALARHAEWKSIVTSTTLQRQRGSFKALAQGLSAQLEQSTLRHFVHRLVARWRGWAATRGRHRRLLHRVRRQRRTRRLERVMAIWRQHVRRRARLATLRQSRARMLSEFGFRRWTALVTWRRRLRQLRARWQRGCRRQCVRRLFDAWRRIFVDHRQTCRRAVAQCAHKAAFAMRRAAWGQWRCAQLCLCDHEATLRRTLVRVWTKWHQYVLRARQMQRQLRRCLRGALQAAYRCAWQTWQIHTAVSRHLARTAKPVAEAAAIVTTVELSTPLECERSDCATHTDVYETESAVALKELQAAHAALLTVYEQRQQDAGEYLRERAVWRRQLDDVLSEKTQLIRVLDECKARLVTAKHLAHDNRALRALVADSSAQRQQIAQLTGRCALGERMLQRLELELTNERSERARELDAHHAHTTELTLQLATVREHCTHLEDMERYNIKLQHKLALQEDRWQRAKLASFEATLQRMDATTKPEP